MTLEMLLIRIRHWLVRKLACGDMVMLNYERRRHGAIWPKNPGPCLVYDCEFEGWGDEDFLLTVGPNPAIGKSIVQIGYANQNSYMRECWVHTQGPVKPTN